MNNVQLSHKERLEIVQSFHNEMEAGNEEKAFEIAKKIPLAPHLAKGIKDMYGSKYLIELGFDLSLAEAVYGKNWLN